MLREIIKKDQLDLFKTATRSTRWNLSFKFVKFRNSVKSLINWKITKLASSKSAKGKLDTKPISLSSLVIDESQYPNLTIHQLGSYLIKSVQEWTLQHENSQAMQNFLNYLLQKFEIDALNSKYLYTLIFMK